jgi:Family of unknown function (DUF6220)
MRSSYRVLAYIIAVEVFVQAAAITFAVAGFFKWIDDGNTVDKAVLEDENLSFTGLAGFIIHGMNGMMVIPFLALVLLIVSFFAKVPGGVKWAGGILALVVVQVLLGIFAHETPLLGPFHGINALVLLGVAVTAGRRVSSTDTEDLSDWRQVEA